MIHRFWESQLQCLIFFYRKMQIILMMQHCQPLVLTYQFLKIFKQKILTPLSLNPSYIYYIKNFHYIKLINKILLNNMCSI